MISLTYRRQMRRYDGKDVSGPIWGFSDHRPMSICALFLVGGNSLLIDGNYYGGIPRPNTCGERQII